MIPLSAFWRSSVLFAPLSVLFPQNLLVCHKTLWPPEIQSLCFENRGAFPLALERTENPRTETKFEAKGLLHIFCAFKMPLGP